MAAQVRLQVVEPGADAEALDALGRRLQEEISQLDVDAVEPAHDTTAPEGTRGVDAATAGALIVSVAPAVAAMSKLVGVVVDWLRRGGSGQTVRIRIGDDELELTGAPAAAQQRLVNDWIRAHALE